MKMRNLNIVIVLLSVFLFTSFGQTQEARKADNYDNKEHFLPCKLETKFIDGQGPTGKANLDRSDFPDNFDPAVWSALQNPATNMFNQAATAINQAFAYTFHFPGWANSGRECCRCTDAILTVKLKALQTGGPNGASGNDDIVIYSSLAPGPSHSVVSQRIWPNNYATAGQTETLTFKIPCKYLTNGHISMYVEDDTAVLSAQLALSRCCLTPEGK